MVEKKNIGKYNVIGDNCSFGNDVNIGNFCEIHDGCDIGDNVTIQGRVRIAENCIIEDDVVLKYGCILTHKTHIGKRSFLGPNVITLGANHKREIIDGCKIGRRCFIGAGSIIYPNIRICSDVIVGAMSFVKDDIDLPSVYVGIPARFKKWRK